MKIRHSELEVIALRHRVIELEDFIKDLRDEILYPLSFKESELGQKAECFGSSAANLLKELKGDN